MPRARFTLNSPAASAAPVPPAHTSAWARPCETARAACTIDASGVPLPRSPGRCSSRSRPARPRSPRPSGTPFSSSRGAEQQDPRTFFRGQRGTGRNLGRTQIGAIAIDRHDRRDHRPPIMSADRPKGTGWRPHHFGYSWSWPCSPWSCVLCTTTSLPAYVPHTGHTLCGLLGLWHFGHAFTVGLTILCCARRLAVRLCDCFFLGTAIGRRRLAY